MTFRDTIDLWPSRSSVRGAAVINEDGLLVYDELGTSLDGEAIAALAVTLHRHARQFGAAAAGGGLGSVVLEFDQGPALVAALDDRHTLVVLALPDRDIGQLLFDIRAARADLATVI